MARRAKTLVGLLVQYLGTRWSALGKGAKVAVFAGLVLVTAAAFQLAACAFGGCPLSSGPCSANQSPCSMQAADADEPCPYAAQREAAAAEAAADEDVPPCHRQ